MLWLTLSIVRSLAIRSLWQNESRRFEYLFDVWRQLARRYIEDLPPGEDRARRTGGLGVGRRRRSVPAAEEG